MSHLSLLFVSVIYVAGSLVAQCLQQPAVGDTQTVTRSDSHLTASDVKYYDHKHLRGLFLLIKTEMKKYCTNQNTLDNDEQVTDSALDRLHKMMSAIGERARAERRSVDLQQLLTDEILTYVTRQCRALTDNAQLSLRQQIDGFWAAAEEKNAIQVMKQSISSSNIQDDKTSKSTYKKPMNYIINNPFIKQYPVNKDFVVYLPLTSDATLSSFRPRRNSPRTTPHAPRPRRRGLVRRPTRSVFIELATMTAHVPRARKFKTHIRNPIHQRARIENDKYASQHHRSEKALTTTVLTEPPSDAPSSPAVNITTTSISLSAGTSSPILAVSFTFPKGYFKEYDVTTRTERNTQDNELKKHTTSAVSTINNAFDKVFISRLQQLEDRLNIFETKFKSDKTINTLHNTTRAGSAHSNDTIGLQNTTDYPDYYNNNDQYNNIEMSNETKAALEYLQQYGQDPLVTHDPRPTVDTSVSTRDTSVTIAITSVAPAETSLTNADISVSTAKKSVSTTAKGLTSTDKSIITAKTGVSTTGTSVLPTTNDDGTKQMALLKVNLTRRNEFPDTDQLQPAPQLTERDVAQFRAFKQLRRRNRGVYRKVGPKLENLMDEMEKRRLWEMNPDFNQMLSDIRTLTELPMSLNSTTLSAHASNRDWYAPPPTTNADMWSRITTSTTRDMTTPYLQVTSDVPEFHGDLILSDVDEEGDAFINLKELNTNVRGNTAEVPRVGHNFIPPPTLWAPAPHDALYDPPPHEKRIREKYRRTSPSQDKLFRQRLLQMSMNERRRELLRRVDRNMARLSPLATGRRAGGGAASEESLSDDLMKDEVLRELDKDLGLRR